jgi:hypothetical protein
MAGPDEPHVMKTGDEQDATPDEPLSDYFDVIPRANSPLSARDRASTRAIDGRSELKETCVSCAASFRSGSACSAFW